MADRISLGLRRWWLSKVQQRLYRRLARSARRVHGRGPLLVAIGDSHTDPGCAYTLPRQAWPRIVGRKKGYETVNLGVSGDTTGDMRLRIEQTLRQGQPEIAVVFGGSNDALRHVDPAETKQNVTSMVEWLHKHGVRRIVLIGPGWPNWQPAPDWVAAADEVRRVLGEVAERYGAIFVDLSSFLRGRIDRGKDLDFSRIPYTQSRSWHVEDGDPHFNAYGQRLIAEAFFAATADWRPARRRRPLSSLRRARLW